MSKHHFVFVEAGFGSEGNTRTQVRSAAALHSHRVGPRKPKRSRKLMNSADYDELPVTGMGKFRLLSEEKVQQKVLALPQASRTLPCVERSPLGSTGAEDLGRHIAHNLLLPVPTPKKTMVGQATGDPFELYPVPPQPWFPQVLANLSDFMSRAWAALPITRVEREKALLWVHRQTLSDPTYFYMNMLSVSGDLSDKGQIDTSVIPWLTSQVVTSLNEALSNPKTALSVGTIMTVSRLTLHEIFLGNSEAGQKIHRPAFARMLVLAGGVDSLKLPAIVRASWSWSERLIVKTTGVTIADLEPSLADEPVFQQGRDLSDDLKVLAGYLPRRELQAGRIVLTNRPADRIRNG